MHTFMLGHTVHTLANANNPKKRGFLFRFHAHNATDESDFFLGAVIRGMCKPLLVPLKLYLTYCLLCGWRLGYQHVMMSGLLPVDPPHTHTLTAHHQLWFITTSRNVKESSPYFYSSNSCLNTLNNTHLNTLLHRMHSPNRTWIKVKFSWIFLFVSRRGPKHLLQYSGFNLWFAFGGMFRHTVRDINTWYTTLYRYTLSRLPHEGSVGPLRALMKTQWAESLSTYWLTSRNHVIVSYSRQHSCADTCFFTTSWFTDDTSYSGVYLKSNSVYSLFESTYTRVLS